jgi:hypothetical protein
MVATLVFTSCGEQENIQYDSVNGQEALQFTSTSIDVTVPSEGVQITLPVSVTKLSNVDRSYTAALDESSSAIAGSFTIGAITIPAGSYDGTLAVDLNTNSLEDGILYELVIKLDAPAGGSVFNALATVKYNKEVICNDVEIVINTDFYGEETRVEITDSNGVVVWEVDYNTYPRGYNEYKYDVNLPDGCYTFTIYDAFCDGQQSRLAGNYLVSCSILTHASGEGSFVDNGGCFESTDFAINVECP